MRRDAVLFGLLMIACSTAAYAVPPANPGDRYKAMSKRCKAIADRMRTTSHDNVTTQMLFDASRGSCDYRENEPAKWRG